MPADLNLRQHNFSAGPGALPEEVLLELRDELPVYPGLGASIAEVSHRSKEYVAISDRAEARLRSLLGLGEDWHVMFLGGGASLQFHMAPLNLIPAGGAADYLDTGEWARKAVKEGHIVGGSRGATVTVAASSADTNYDHIPPREAWALTPGAAYLHVTSNNTIFGTQLAETPRVEAPLVCDASSDFLSRPMDLDAYDLIYAGAQKNIGPAGVTVVLVRDRALDRVDGLPSMLDYRTHAGRMFHTPPVLAVVLVDKVLGWIERQGGLSAMEARAKGKADRLYGAIDATDFYTGTARADSRSRMNVCFRLPSEDLEARFVKEAAGEGLMALKGYRTVGGIRASIYNAVEPAGVEALVQFMQAFEAAGG